MDCYIFFLHVNLTLPFLHFRELPKIITEILLQYLKGLKDVIFFNIAVGKKTESNDNVSTEHTDIISLVYPS